MMMITTLKTRTSIICNSCKTERLPPITFLRKILHMCIHINIHPYIYTHIHLYTHTYIHTYKHVFTHTYIHACVSLKIHTLFSDVSGSKSKNFTSSFSPFCFWTKIRNASRRVGEGFWFSSLEMAERAAHSREWFCQADRWIENSDQTQNPKP